MKSIEFLDSNDQKNYFLKKTSTKSPNLTYLSLDTSQNEKFLFSKKKKLFFFKKSIVSESKRKFVYNEIENASKEILSKSHLEERGKQSNN